MRTSEVSPFVKYTISIFFSNFFLNIGFIIMVFFYIALFTLLPQQAGVIANIYMVFLNLLSENTVPLAADFTSSEYYHL